DGGSELSIVWQVLPYVFLTTGEVLVAATGLEFAYSQAPPSMKGVIMSFWLLTTTIGNLWVLLTNAFVGTGQVAFKMFFFAGFAFAAAAAFGWRARRYRMVDHYRVASQGR